MSLPDDLLEQARHLATYIPRKPKQASLRRAVSSAYYALFHLLVDAAAGLYTSDPIRKSKIGRTFSHGELMDVSERFAIGQLPKSVPAIAGSDGKEQEQLKGIAKTFVLLQIARHEADYDLTRTFARQEVLDLIERAETCFKEWEDAKRSEDARLFLACFHMWKKWDVKPR